MKFRSTVAITSLALLALTACSGPKAPEMSANAPASASASETGSVSVTASASGSASASVSVSSASPSASSSTSASASASSESSDSDGDCGLTGSDATTIDVPIKVDEWVERGNGEFPRSDKYGGNDRGFNALSPVCFSHSPEGAVLALATYWGSPYSPEDLRDSFEDRALPAPLGEYFVDNYVKGMEETLGEGENLDTMLSLFTTKTVAYKLVSYDGNTAVVSIAQSINGLEDEYMKFTFPLVWHKDDWYLDLEALVEFGEENSFTTIENLDGMDVFTR